MNEYIYICHLQYKCTLDKKTGVCMYRNAYNDGMNNTSIKFPQKYKYLLRSTRITRSIEQSVRQSTRKSHKQD